MQKHNTPGASWRWQSRKPGKSGPAPAAQFPRTSRRVKHGASPAEQPKDAVPLYVNVFGRKSVQYHFHCPGEISISESRIPWAIGSVEFGRTFQVCEHGCGLWYLKPQAPVRRACLRYIIAGGNLYAQLRLRVQLRRNVRPNIVENQNHTSHGKGSLPLRPHPARQLWPSAKIGGVPFRSQHSWA